MADIILTVKVKNEETETPTKEVQPKQNYGDMKIEQSLNILNNGKMECLLKALKTMTKFANFEIELYYSGSGDYYSLNKYRAGKQAMSMIKNPLNATFELYQYIREREIQQKWENRDAEQAARRSGNYLTGNSR